MSGFGLQHRAEALGSRLPPLMVAAERVAATVAQGVHGRRRVGQGETFWQFRQFQTGDSITSIDWRQSAKSEHLFLRELEWEAAQTVWLWCDLSPSMDYRSRTDGGRWRRTGTPNLPTKRDRAALLAVALSSLLVRAGEHVGLLDSPAAPGRSRATLARIADTLSRGPKSGEEPPSLPPDRSLPRHATLVWVSDFLSPVDDIVAKLRAFGSRGLRGHMVQVLDPAEHALPFDGRVMFEGMEGEPDLLVRRVDELRGAYRTRMSARRQALSDAARRMNWTFMRHGTDQPPQGALLTLYGAIAGPGGIGGPLPTAAEADYGDQELSPVSSRSGPSASSTTSGPDDAGPADLGET